MAAVSQISSGPPVSVPDEVCNVPGVASPFLVEAGSISRPGRKKLVRRDDHEYSQPLRLGAQLFLVALNAWIGVQFYLWVGWAESGGRGLEVSRPAGVEGWLPIEGLMQLKYFVLTRQLPQVHAAGFFLFVSFLAMSVVFRKSFCSWLCPVGTVSEYLWKLGRATFHRNFQLPRWADIALRSLKYLVLSFFVYAVASMSAGAIAEFLGSPYALVVDVRMLNFFRYLGTTTALVILGMVIASIFIQNFWCRYLCPYGAFLGLVSLFSPARITRNLSTCIDCAKCAKACPSALPVDKLIQIRSAECTGCLECVAVCPARDALTLSVPAGLRKRRAIPVWSMAAGIAIIFFGLVGYAKYSNHWNTELPKHVYLELVPAAEQQQHPASPGQ
ncbi:MAG: 4Fe-4S binding protein [Candidatus Korobacteraceae bacterium]